MAFNGTEGGEISLQTASAMTAEYRREHPNERLGHFFGREIIERLLAQEGSVGIRMYYGINEEHERELVLVAADRDMNDLTDLVADVSFPCPDACSNPNSLNS